MLIPMCRHIAQKNLRTHLFLVFNKVVQFLTATACGQHPRTQIQRVAASQLTGSMRRLSLPVPQESQRSALADRCRVCQFVCTHVKSAQNITLCHALWGDPVMLTLGFGLCIQSRLRFIFRSSQKMFRPQPKADSKNHLHQRLVFEPSNQSCLFKLCAHDD
jgi:hypothetical protein